MIWLVRVEMDPTRKQKYRDFVYNVAYQLLQEFGQPSKPIRGRPATYQPDRIVEGIERHYIVNTEKRNGRRDRVVCHVCYNTTRGNKKKVRVNTICQECNVGLCIGECFRDFHTLKNF